LGKLYGHLLYGHGSIRKKKGVGEVVGNRVHHIRQSPARWRWELELGSLPM